MYTLAEAKIYTTWHQRKPIIDSVGMQPYRHGFSTMDSDRYGLYFVSGCLAVTFDFTDEGGGRGDGGHGGGEHQPCRVPEKLQ